MRPLLVRLREHDPISAPLARKVGAEIAEIELRHFPDGETYLRYGTSPAGRHVAIVCSLDRPDDKLLPVIFAAAAARDLGAKSIGLVSPYLAYMRQDRRFHSGEAVTSRYFARMLSHEFDWLVTVDPHLHRLTNLSEIYSIPAYALHAAPLVADWIRSNVDKALLVGPDGESEQWVENVARDAGVPYIVLEKIRHGDRDVVITVPDVERWRDHTPVLVDDIVSTARTMIETIGHLVSEEMRPPVCIAVHGIFAGSAYADLVSAGASRIVTSNTVVHKSNAIDVTGMLAARVGQFLAAGTAKRGA